MVAASMEMAKVLSFILTVFILAVFKQKMLCEVKHFCL
jgi:hypothetical protein